MAKFLSKNGKFYMRDGKLLQKANSLIWVIKSDASGELVTTQIAFTSNGQKFTSIGAVYDDSGTFIILRYDNNEVAGLDIYGGGYGFEFDNEAYRTVVFETAPTGELLTWLQANAIPQ